MHLRRTTLGAAIALVAAATAVSGTGAATEQRAALHLDVTEWAVVPSGGLLPAGSVRVTVANVGYAPHQLVIVRTPRWGVGQLPAGPALARATVGRALLVQPGTIASETVTLTPGSYVAYDNLNPRTNAAVAFSVA